MGAVIFADVLLGAREAMPDAAANIRFLFSFTNLSVGLFQIG